jgi:Holliday junction resolvasome RuvABC endonuclease subunit
MDSTNKLFIDPGTKAGATIIFEDNWTVESWDLTPIKPTKKRVGEPKYFRLKNLWDHLAKVHSFCDLKIIVFEGAAGFQRGKSAVEASHKYRAVIELFCALNGIELLELPPNDLKFFALGKRAGDKDEMIRAAQSMGYEGDNDNEADSYLIAKWYLTNYTF